MSRAACMDCRQRAGSKSPTTVRTCACGYTSSYCRKCGGRKRVNAEIEAHKTTCIPAERKEDMDRRVAALGCTIYSAEGVIHVPGPPYKPKRRGPRTVTP